MRNVRFLPVQRARKLGEEVGNKSCEAVEGEGTTVGTAAVDDVEARAVPDVDPVEVEAVAGW